MPARYCKRGHDTEQVGRTKSRNCRECLRAWDRARNAKRRLDPAYVAAEADYKSAWGAFRGYMRQLAHGTQAKLDQLRAEYPAMASLVGPSSTAFEPHRDWDGDPHSLSAPPYRYRMRAGYPRVNREAVAAKGRLSLYRMLREQRGIA